MRCRQGTLCNNFILSSSVTVTADALVINVPALPMRCGCLVIAQAIPDTATVNLPVTLTIGTDTTSYNVVGCNGVQLSAAQLDTRRRYPYRFITGNTGSVVQLGGSRCPYNTLPV